MKKNDKKWAMISQKNNTSSLIDNSQTEAKQDKLSRNFVKMRPTRSFPVTAGTQLNHWMWSSGLQPSSRPLCLAQLLRGPRWTERGGVRGNWMATRELKNEMLSKRNKLTPKERMKQNANSADDRNKQGSNTITYTDRSQHHSVTN